MRANTLEAEHGPQMMTGSETDIRRIKFNMVRFPCETRAEEIVSQNTVRKHALKKFSSKFGLYSSKMVSELLQLSNPVPSACHKAHGKSTILFLLL